MKYFNFIIILHFITLFSYSQDGYLPSQEIELPKINKVEELMKAEKLQRSTQPVEDVDSDYGMNLDMFRPKLEQKQRFDDFTTSTYDEVYETQDDGTRKAKFENYIPGTDNNERLAQQKLADSAESGLIDKVQIKSNNYYSILYAFIVIIFSIFLIKRIYK